MASQPFSATWLTGLLRASGQLERGDVQAVAVDLWRNKRLSRLYRLQVRYDVDVSLPAHFVLKISRPGPKSSLARRRRWKEFEFYSRVVPAMETPPIPRVFAATFDVSTLQSVLLLEDLSQTHTRPATPLPAATPDFRGNIDCLAAIHAWWWAHPELVNVTSSRDPDWIQARTAAMRRTVGRFITEYAAELPAASLAALQAASSGYANLLQRSALMPLTIVHGDAHPWNFLNPREPGSRPTCLVDWESWSIEPGPQDLTSMLSLHLPPRTRTIVEGRALEHYQRRLQEHGVSGYDLEACRDDYRRSVARRVLSPVGMWARGSSISTWGPMLERITTAFFHLQCDQLL